MDRAGRCQESIDPSGDVMLGYWWSDQPSITLNNISVRYSNSTGTTTKTEPKSDESSKGGKWQQFPVKHLLRSRSTR
ncbi:MAG: hypothetical protein ACLSFT_07990 [Ruminococcus callidus]